jgi:uncharacterized membrane protein YfcA
MFLSLLFFARLPLLTALALAKLANSASALTGLIIFSATGHVNFYDGILLAVGMLGGAYSGAQMARKNAAVIVRPILTVVVVLLIGKIVYDQIYLS